DIQGERPTVADYLSRFPEHQAVIRRLFDERAPDLDQARVSVPPTRDGAVGTLSFPLQPPQLPPETWPTIPGYELVEPIDSGGQGYVFKAWQQWPRRLVALKIMKCSALGEPHLLARFLFEAEATAHLQHPHIVQIYDANEFKGQPYLALEFVDGGDLANKLGHKPQPPREAARQIEALARAVDYAHKRGILHRDLKPRNVLL